KFMVFAIKTQFQNYQKIQTRKTFLEVSCLVLYEWNMKTRYMHVASILYKTCVLQMSSPRGQVLSGTDVSKEIRQQLTEDVAKIKTMLPGFEPGLAIVQVGGREDSNVYIRMKIKAASEIGIKAEHVQLP
ncbi:hypothetical protein AMK59_6411, partial [Oryctes borbonicus]